MLTYILFYDLYYCNCKFARCCKIFSLTSSKLRLNIVICSFQQMLKLKESGRVRHVGVSNMNEEQLGRLCAVEKPACLQVEVHVLFQQKQLIAAANRLGIPVVAYSPLGSKALADALAAKTG